MRYLMVALTLVCLAVASASADDQQLTQQIAERLRAHKAEGNLQQFDIRLKVQDGAVYLHGYVATSEQKQLALNVARQTSGVRHVFNRIRVRPRLETSPWDSPTRIARDADEKLPPAPIPDGLDTLLRRDTSSGLAGTTSWPDPLIVTLQLKPDSQQHDPRFSHLSSRRASPAPNESDTKKIARRLIERLQQEQASGHLYEFRIELSVEQGVVRMRGRVSTAEQRQLALQIAEQIVGVGQVINELQISGAIRKVSLVASAPSSVRLPPINVTIRLPQTSHGD